MLHFFIDVKMSSCCYSYTYPQLGPQGIMSLRPRFPEWLGRQIFQCPQLGWGHWVESRRGRDIFKIKQTQIQSSTHLRLVSPKITCCLSLMRVPHPHTQFGTFVLNILKVTFVRGDLSFFFLLPSCQMRSRQRGRDRGGQRRDEP